MRDEDRGRHSKGKHAAGQKTAKRLRTVSLLSLEPFAFFVRAPPVAYAQHYCQLADYMEGLVNGDFAAGERSFAAATTESPSWFAAEGGATWLDGDSKLFFREQWKDIEAAVNDARQTQTAWKKLTLTDKILGLYDAEGWKSTQHQTDYMPFERELWWVKTAKGWFSSDNSSSYKGYLRIAASALILELWYRFVWAGHTYRVYRDIHHRRKESAHMSDKQETEEPDESEAMVEEAEPKDEYDTEEVVDPHAAMTHGDEDDDGDEEHDDVQPTEEIDLVSARRRTRGRISTNQGVSPSRKHKGMEEDSASDSEETDEAEELAGDGQVSVDVIPSVVSVFFAHPTVVRALDAAESRYFERMEAAERMLASAVPSAPTFSPYGGSSQLPTGHSSAEVPESPETQFWQFDEVMEAFVDLVERRNGDYKMVDQPSRADIASDLCKLYRKRFVPFLHMLGIEIACPSVAGALSYSSPSSPDLSALLFRWRWRRDMPPEFVAQVYVTCMRNITCDGTVACGRHILDLLPEIFLLADSRLETVLPQVATRIEEVLKQKGKFDEEVNSLVAMLDELLAEKNAIMQNQQPGQSGQRGGQTMKKLIGQRVEQLRGRRLQEIEDTIRVIQTELNTLTAGADSVPASLRSLKQQRTDMEEEEEEDEDGAGSEPLLKPKKLKKRPDKLPRTKETENEHAMSLTTAGQILHAAGVDGDTVLVSLSPSDGTLQFAASSLFHARRTLSCYNAATKKVSQLRIKGLRDLSLERTRRDVERILDRLCPEVKRRRGRRKAGEILAGDVFAVGSQQSDPSETDWTAVASELEREAGLPLDDPTPEQAGQLPEMLHTLQASTTAKARELMVTRIAKHLHQRAEGGLFSSMIHNRASVDQILDFCRETLEGMDSAGAASLQPSRGSLVLAMSAAYLWDLRFSKDRHKREAFQRIIQMGEAHPARFRMVVYNGLDPREYLQDIHGFIPWRLEARGRVYERELVAEGGSDKLVRIGQLYLGKGQRREAHVEAFVREHYTPGLIRDYYVFYPNSRAPIVPYHYGLHSLHLVPGVDSAGHEPCRSASLTPGAGDEGESFQTQQAAGVGRAWQFYCKGRIDYPNGLPGTTVLALWERKPDEPESGAPLEWEQAIRKWVHTKGFDAKRVEQLLLENLFPASAASSGAPWAALLRGHEGLFMISDHPGRATVICTPSYLGRLRFYTSDPASATSPAEVNFPYQQITFPVDQPQPALVVRHHQLSAQDVMFKYALLGNAAFWALEEGKAEGGPIDRLRASVEDRIDSSPDDFVADARTGPLAWGALRAQLDRDVLQANQHNRLVSCVEEWAAKELAADGRENDVEVVFAAVMNISLECPANWRYWEEMLQLPCAADGRPVAHPNWTKLTCPASVPRAYLPQSDGIGAAHHHHRTRARHAMEMETAAAYTTVLDSMERSLLQERGAE